MKNPILLFFGLVAVACTNRDELSVLENSSQQTQESLSRQELLGEFGRALSAVVSENPQVREFVKAEALKQFDKNYDVLWVEARHAQIEGKSLRAYLEEKSSPSLVAKVETEVPRLNILLPDLPFVNLHPEDYDASSVDLPIIVPSEKYNYVYEDGILTDSIEKGYAPSSHVLVVNENSRVIVGQDVARSLNGRSYRFISPNYDGTAQESLRSAVLHADTIGRRTIAAWTYFYKDDASINSKALQRDYIYYGMTPTNRSGELNYNVSEYLSFIEIDPKMFTLISDQENDPKIDRDMVSRRTQDFSKEELIDLFWTKGVYNIRVEVQRSTSEHPEVLYIPVRPHEIWNFAYDEHHRSLGLFRRSKHFYWIKPERFTPKRYYLPLFQFSLGKWNISEESLYRTISFMEEDESGEDSYTYQYESIRANASKFNFGMKLGLGLDKNSLGLDASTEVTNSNTTRENKTVVVKGQKGFDHMGSIRIYFYDPIIEKKVSSSQYQIKTYTTGHVVFGVVAY